MKRCPKCGRTKRCALFYTNRAQRDGLSTWCKACDKKAKWSSYDPAVRRAKRLTTYGLTETEYSELLASHGGLCAICTRRPAAVIDHDHVTGQVRGLLCQSCNRGLGLLGDTTESLRQALEYLCQI